MSNEKAAIPLEFQRHSAEHMCQHAKRFHESMSRRRSVREFSDHALPEGLLEDAIRAAGTAPSGANMQPWHFVVVRDPATKRRVRQAAEAEERAFYERRASDEWLAALEPLGTDANKPFLETAPALIAIFLQRHSVDAQGNKRKHYYTAESVGIATGILITALHQAGVATLTHTPSPMRFLNEILDRPKKERPYLLLVCGLPADGATVPDLTRRELAEISTFI